MLIKWNHQVHKSPLTFQLSVSPKHSANTPVPAHVQFLSGTEEHRMGQQNCLFEELALLPLELRGTVEELQCNFFLKNGLSLRLKM